MSGLLINLEARALSNEYFREVLYTDDKLQLVVMTIEPLEDIGAETHKDADQFIVIESGEASVVLDGNEHLAEEGYAILIPAGVNHNIINNSETNRLKIYTIYCPPEHAPGTVHEKKSDAGEEAAED